MHTVFVVAQRWLLAQQCSAGPPTPPPLPHPIRGTPDAAEGSTFCWPLPAPCSPADTCQQLRGQHPLAQPAAQQPVQGPVQQGHARACGCLAMRRGVAC